MSLSPPHDEQVQRWACEALQLESDAAAKRLDRLGFRKPIEAVQVLDRLAGPRQMLVPLPPRMLVALAHTPDPDRGLRNLERLIEICGSNALYSRLESEPDMGFQLATVLALSPFLADILVRNPEYLTWLFGVNGCMSNSLSRNEFRLLFKQSIRAGAEREERLDALRKVHRRELLRIGAGEMLDAKPVSKTCAELACLADAVLEVACAEAMTSLANRFGKPLDTQGKPARFCVICLGKHGGQELNFSSDIDLLFVYDEEGKTVPGRSKRSINNSEFFHRVGEQLIDDLTVTTAEGFFYRVDMRLRPEGPTGPLVRSLRSYWIHYEAHGQLWERQMLLKARRGAGSHAVWRRFKEMITPFVFPLVFDVGPLQEISRIKRRIEREVVAPDGTSVNLKLAPGGIRDIEFIVQALQLLNGRARPKVKSHRTLPAIHRLAAATLLDKEEARRLAHCYQKFRRIENLLQIEEGRATHDLPSDKSGIAHLLGLTSATELELELNRLLASVRKIYDGVFHQDSTDRDDLEWLLDADERAADAQKHLAGYGFTAPAGARELLSGLAAGAPHPSARRSLTDLLPPLLTSFSGMPEPDNGLRRFCQIVAAYGAPGVFYGVMRNHPNLLRLLSMVCGSSVYLAQLIEHDPSLVDALIAVEDTPTEQLWHKAEPAAIKSWHNKVMLRIGCNLLLGEVAQEETFRSLSEHAEKLLQLLYLRAWNRIVKQVGKPRTRSGQAAAMACFAGGKFGGGEISFGSDLDLFFIYGSDGKTGRGSTNKVFFVELVQELTKEMHNLRLYKVDARLRPDGRSAPLALSLAGYRTYLAKRTADWERLALSRARFVAGDAMLGVRVQSAIDRFLFSKPVDAEFARAVVDMRGRMEPVSRGGSEKLDIKRGIGGLVDIEFLAQVFVLKAEGKITGYQRTNTSGALARAVELKYIKKLESSRLSAAYRLLRGVEQANRLMGSSTPGELPANGDKQVMAQILGLSDGKKLAKEVFDSMTRTRKLFEVSMAKFLGGRQT